MNPREIQAAGGAGKWNNDCFVLDGWTPFLVSVRGRGEATARRYRRLVERLLADAGKPVTQLGREDIERHLRRLHVAGRGESVRAARSLGEWCLAHGIGEVNPGASLSGPRPYRRKIKALTVGEVSSLLWGDKPGVHTLARHLSGWPGVVPRKDHVVGAAGHSMSPRSPSAYSGG